MVLLLINNRRDGRLSDQFHPYNQRDVRRFFFTKCILHLRGHLMGVTSSSQWIKFALLISCVKHTHWQTDFLYRNEGTTNCHRTVKEIRCLFLLLNVHHSSTFNSNNTRWTVPRRKWTSRGAQNIQIASSYLSGSTLKWSDFSLWRFFNGNVLIIINIIRSSRHISYCNWYSRKLLSHLE